jgi:MATE family multidrug resistance protein
MALILSVPGCGLLLWPAPFLAVAQVGPDVEPMVRSYLGALAIALPGSLLFTAFRGFSTAIANTRMVMRLQLSGLALKAPLSALLVFGIGTPGDALHLPGLGVLGCGIATAIALWTQTLLAWRSLRRDPAYARFGVQGRGLGGPDPARLRTHLRLGLPMGLSILIEVTGFTFMAIFIARLGSTAVAGHQIAANLVALMFMMPLSIAQASSALVAQQVGAGEMVRARAMGWHAVGLGAALAALLGGGVFLAREGIARAYTHDLAVIAAATPLLSWVALFHLADALQTVAAFVLRAWHIATAPMVIYALSLWGVGLGGGWWLAFAGGAAGPQGAPGFWRMATLGLGLASLALLGWLALAGRAAARESRLTPRGPASSG